MPKVSVIVPVYNVYDYLDKCLNSLVNQTLDDIEIIVVNDGSPDNSKEIISKYEKKYPKKVKGFEKKNGGLSDARNFGLRKATGEYIAFLDSDDYVLNTMYEEMYNKITSDDFDMVICDLDYVYNDDVTMNVSCGANKDMLSRDDIKSNMNKLYPAAWNKLFKKDLFNYDVRFKKGVWFEDVEFIFRLYPYMNKIGVINKPFNKYVQRKGAITSTFDKRLYHYIDNFNGIIKFYKDNNFFDAYYYELEYAYVRYLYATFIKASANYPSKEEYKNAVNEAIKNVKLYFPNYRKNGYFYKSFKGIYLVCFNKLLANLIYITKKR